MRLIITLSTVNPLLRAFGVVLTLAQGLFSAMTNFTCFHQLTMLSFIVLSIVADAFGSCTHFRTHVCQNSGNRNVGNFEQRQGWEGGKSARDGSKYNILKHPIGYILAPIQINHADAQVTPDIDFLLIWPFVLFPSICPGTHENNILEHHWLNFFNISCHHFCKKWKVSEKHVFCMLLLCKASHDMLVRNKSVWKA